MSIPKTYLSRKCLKNNQNLICGVCHTQLREPELAKKWFESA